MLDSDYDVLPGDSVVTSGLGLYPKDIVIGEVTKVTEDKSKSLKYVVVKPNVKLQKYRQCSNSRTKKYELER